MSSSTALLFIGLTVLTVQMVIAAPHCVKKPVTQPRNCSLKTFKDGYLTEAVFEDSFNVSCTTYNSKTKTIALVIDHEDARGKSYRAEYLLPTEVGDQIWANIHCTDEKDLNGTNIVRSNLVPAGHRVTTTWCVRQTITVAEYKELFPGSIDWTPEKAKES